ncbi:hypothetical protein DFH27DRAFT_56794 [Peziza echinospora]|nr:hypothetical protein DFH27DRAFT_56794 [Peziza echinospora]
MVWSGLVWSGLMGIHTLCYICNISRPSIPSLLFFFLFIHHTLSLSLSHFLSRHSLGFPCVSSVHH